MKQKLSRVTSPWHRLSITVFVRSLLLIDHFARPRSRVHWVGRYSRPRRLERALILLLFGTAMVLLEQQQYVLWATMLGGMMSIFVVLRTIYRLFPRKRAHLIK